MLRRVGRARLVSGAALIAVALAAAATVRALGGQPGKPLTVIALGDTRFTDPSNVTATSPLARAALIARIAQERPDTVVISGDVPWHGVTGDYARFGVETEPWRALHIRVLPASAITSSHGASRRRASKTGGRHSRTCAAGAGTSRTRAAGHASSRSIR